MMGVGWIETAQALTFPVSAFGLLLLALVSFIRTLPALRRVRMESDASLRHALDDGAKEHIARLESHIEDLMKWRREDAKKIKALEQRTEECEQERAVMRGQIAELQAMLNARGEIRQRAQLIVAAEKFAEKERGK